MKLLCALPLLTFIGLISGDRLSAETQARIAADYDNTCSPSGVDCYLLDPVGDYMTASVTFDGADNDGSACCYTYTAEHNESASNCLTSGNTNPSLSHLNFDTFCDGQNIVLVSSTKAGTLENMESRDGSTCYRGFKFDEGFEKEDPPQTYEMCITWDTWTSSSTCDTRVGWYMIKAGGAFDFEEIQVPWCREEPITPAPVTPAPITPAPITPAPITPAPVTPAPSTPAPITPAPVTPAPITPAPITPAPVTPAPITPAPVTPAPITPAPVTPAPITPAPITPAPVTPGPMCPDMGDAFVDQPHRCVCVDALVDCPADNEYCKSLTFVARVLGEGPVTDPCGEGEICCCHCPVCPLS